MRKSVDYRLLTLATLFGFLGGALSSIALPQLAFAQDEPPDKIVAHQFRVVDDRGEVVGVFGAGPSGPRILRRDEDGGLQRLPQPGEGRIVLLRTDGTVAWSAPGRTLLRPLTSVPYRQPSNVESQRLQGVR